jgi:streptogramin lyase
MIWHLEIPDSPGGSSGPRPTQWEGGKHSDDPCEVDPNPRLWIGYRDASQSAHFIRVDGATGTVLDQATYPNWTHGYGPYGGVVNARGDLWASGLSNAPLLKVDAITLQITDYGNPGSSFYGIGIDASGNPWIAGGNNVSMFDDIAQQWIVIPVQNGGLRGIQIDRQGRVWAAGNSPCGLVELDAATRTVTNQHVALPGCGTPVGVSIDVDGYVWSPDQSTNTAFKLDPETHQVVLVATGLVSPYTYSDMTGAGLGLVTNPPG